uniref:Uncharacterized protein n=1 Tax=Trichuris muris TaxID=70415 RepID=A0A5S6QNI6_TRIMR
MRRRLRVAANLSKRTAQQLKEAAQASLSETTLKYAGYSAHDVTIIALLVDVEHYTAQFSPRFAACVIIELRKYGEQYFIEMFYKRGHYYDPIGIDMIAQVHKQNILFEVGHPEKDSAHPNTVI